MPDAADDLQFNEEMAELDYWINLKYARKAKEKADKLRAKQKGKKHGIND